MSFHLVTNTTLSIFLESAPEKILKITKTPSANLVTETQVWDGE